MNTSKKNEVLMYTSFPKRSSLLLEIPKEASTNMIYKLPIHRLALSTFINTLPISFLQKKDARVILTFCQ